MKVADYDAFVRKTSQFADKPKDEQRAIALYGLVGEIGSVLAAVKKKLLAEDGEAASWNQPNDEVIEELGDALWYCYSVGQTINDAPLDILAADIETLRHEIGSGDERAQRIATSLEPTVRAAFLEAAKSFPPDGGYTFDDYQTLAYKTARTDGQVLLEVCLAVLWQLGAELLRSTLPEIERTLNKNVADRPPNIVLGEIGWHLSAMASLYDLSLNEVIAFNCNKVNSRAERGEHTLLHDEERAANERFPRVFDVGFVRIGPRKSRMYFDGRPLGNDLTDNSYEDDGYRFHDVIHLALIAHLGWSPVVRGLMKRKRKSKDDGVDEVEDGARAQIVEELVIKAIHAEGDRQAKAAGRCIVGRPTRLFPHRGLINFKLLKALRTYAEGLEVAKNAYWEWGDAIFEACDMFHQLTCEKQGTIHVDLTDRKLTFSPTVSPSIHGITVGTGIAAASLDATADAILPDTAEREWAVDKNRVPQTIAAKQAILEALGFDKNEQTLWAEIQVRLVAGNRPYIKVSKSVQERAWESHAIDYTVAFHGSATEIMCMATAIADIHDISK